MRTLRLAGLNWGEMSTKTLPTPGSVLTNMNAGCPSCTSGARKAKPIIFKRCSPTRAESTLDIVLILKFTLNPHDALLLRSTQSHPARYDEKALSALNCCEDLIDRGHGTASLPPKIANETPRPNVCWHHTSDSVRTSIWHYEHF